MCIVFKYVITFLAAIEFIIIMLSFDYQHHKQFIMLYKSFKQQQLEIPAHKK